jgi:hypothetical protein
VGNIDIEERDESRHRIGDDSEIDEVDIGKRRRELQIGRHAEPCTPTRALSATAACSRTAA